MVADEFCRSKAVEQAWVEVSQFYNSYKENSESALKRRSLTSKSKGKQRAIDAETWAIVDRELPVQFQGQKGVDMALRLIEEAPTCGGSSTKLKERLAGMEMKVRSIRSLFLTSRLICSPVQLEGLHNMSREALKCTNTAESGDA